MSDERVLGLAQTAEGGKRTLFRCNIGGIDRVIRWVVGTVLLSTGLFLLITRHDGLTLIGFGAVMLTTAIARFCPLYIPFRISTAHTERNKTGYSKAPGELQMTDRTGGGSS